MKAGMKTLFGQKSCKPDCKIAIGRLDFCRKDCVSHGFRMAV